MWPFTYKKKKLPRLNGFMTTAKAWCAESNLPHILVDIKHCECGEEFAYDYYYGFTDTQLIKWTQHRVHCSAALLSIAEARARLDEWRKQEVLDTRRWNAERAVEVAYEKNR